MYINDEIVLQLRQMIGEIPTKYGAAPYAILSQVIVDNENAKKENKEDGTDLSRISE